MKKKGLDACLFYSFDEPNKNIRYFSGYSGMGCLIILKNEKKILVVPEMEYLRAKESGNKVYVWEKKKRLFKQVNEVLKKEKTNVKKIGIVFREFGLDIYRSFRRNIRNIKIDDIYADCLMLRGVKKKEEEKYLRKSCKIASDIMNRCLKNFKKFKREEDVRRFLHIETVKAGCEFAFDPIVGSGKGGAQPHYMPKNVKLRKGFCVLDFGVRYKGYHSDISRTIYVGKPSKKDIEIYNNLLKVQKNLIKMVKVNVKCSKLYDKAYEELGDAFNHGLGHGVGLQIHELPNLTMKSSDSFKNGMIFTIEPGVYYPNKWGIRIEDTILLKNNKTEILTTVPKSFINC